jgi:hypothetical protein
MDFLIARNTIRRRGTLGNSSLWSNASPNYNINKNTRNGKRKIRDEIKRFFNPLSSYIKYPYTTGLFGYYNAFPLRFYCMNCGREHKERACPRCGSKAVRVG